MKFRDYYAALGVAPDATADEIKSAYRKLARQHHPDVSKAPDAAERFARINEANQALSDPQKRAAYDQLRSAGLREGDEMDAPPPGAEPWAQGGQQHRGGGTFQGFAGDGVEAEDLEGFSDFFQSLFAGMGARGGRARRRARGEDLHHRLAVTLEEAYVGGERELALRLGDGAGGGSTRSLRVKIPAGVADGSTIRLRGQGLPGAEEPGDLYLEIEIIPHRLYRVDGRDVLLDLPVAPWEAALGARVRVPTLGGPVTMTIPANAQGGEKLRLRGRGLPGDPPGDQYLALRIAMPPATSPRAQELWRELAGEAAFDPRAGTEA